MRGQNGEKSLAFLFAGVGNCLERLFKARDDGRFQHAAFIFVVSHLYLIDDATQRKNAIDTAGARPCLACKSAPSLRTSASIAWLMVKPA